MPQGLLHRGVSDDEVLVRMSSFDDNDNSVEVVFSAGARRWTRDPRDGMAFLEELEISEAAIDLSRVASGVVPCLYNHDRHGRALGRVTEAWIENGNAVARIQFSRDPMFSGVVGDIKEGVIRGVSAGYSVQRFEVTRDAEGNEIRIATKWRLMEVSFVTIPAESGTRTRSDEAYNHEEVDQMPDSNTENQSDIEAERRAAAEAERQRIAAIHDIATRADLGGEFIRTHTESGATIEAVRSAALDQVLSNSARESMASSDAGPSSARNDGASAHVTRDEGETLVNRMAAAIESRASATDPTPDAAEFRGMSLVEMARHFAPASHRNAAAPTVVSEALSVPSTRAHGVSDFAAALGGAGQRRLLAAYNEAPQTFRPFVNQIEVPDFRKVERIQVAASAALKHVPEGAEISRGSVGERKETYGLASYARIIGLTRQAIINDDLGAFDDVAAGFAAQARGLETQLVYAVLSGNPEMSDENKLFSAEHGNLAQASAVNVEAISSARALMRKQRSADGVPLNIAPAFLIVSPDNETAADRIVAPIVAQQADNVNTFAGRLTVISDGALEGGDFFVAARPTPASRVVEIAYLSGARGVQSEQRQAFNYDAVEIKATLDFAAAPVDYRGMVKVPAPAG